VEGFNTNKPLRLIWFKNDWYKSASGGSILKLSSSAIEDEIEFGRSRCHGEECHVPPQRHGFVC